MHLLGALSPLHRPKMHLLSDPTMPQKNTHHFFSSIICATACLLTACSSMSADTPPTSDMPPAINLNGTMRVCSAARPLLAKTNGAIVNLASMLSFFGGGLVPGYAASKGGIAQLTKSLAIAYAGDGIRVNAIAPGWIATPLTSALQADPARSQPILSRTPLGRWGTPSDLLGGVLYLCSPAASFVTGTVLVIDGGYAIA